MMLVKSTKNSEAGLPPDPRLMQAIGKLAADQTQRGAIIASGGLSPSSQGVRIRVGGGKLTVIDGPFTESKELIGGYAIFELASKEEALAAGKQFMQVHLDVMGSSYEGELEIRPIFAGSQASAKQGE
jgi:hypothetical protein